MESQYNVDDLLHGITNEKLKEILEEMYVRDPHQSEFLNAVNEVAKSIQPLLDRDERYVPVFAQMCEPERQILFRVPWLDDQEQSADQQRVSGSVLFSYWALQGGD